MSKMTPTTVIAELREAMESHVHTCSAPVAAWMQSLDLIAERIKADESAVPFGYLGDRELQTMRNHGHAQLLCRPLPDLNITTPVYFHPPAQAAQADAAEQASDWFTREFADLNPATACLVWNFALALGNKLSAAEKKYGYTDGWRSPDWMDECRTKLMEHIRKGDPRDVAAYCAFLWHHGASTAPIAKHEVFVCSNPKCTAVYASEPMGHCPACKQVDGSGWSTARSDVL